LAAPLVRFNAGPVLAVKSQSEKAGSRGFGFAEE
jgi:hypothetical protein